jgi:hypothetical protein
LRHPVSTRRARVALALGSTLLGGLIAAPVAFAAVPTNDTWAGRIVVDPLPFSETIDTTEATTDADDVEANAECGAPATDASVWYEFTAASDQGVLVDVSESDYSAGVLVVSGTPGSFVIEACGPGAVAFFATTGVSYSIMAIDDQFDGAGNGGTLSITIDDAPPPPTFDVVVNPVGAFHRDGSATISGTVTCTNADFVELFVELSQQVGRRTITGFGFAGLECDGTEQSWSADVFADNGLFRGGRAATVTVAFGCGFFCTEVVVEQTVRLRK